MREIFEQRLLAAFKGGRRAAREYQDIEDQVREGTLTPRGRGGRAIGTGWAEGARIAGFGQTASPEFRFPLVARRAKAKG